MRFATAILFSLFLSGPFSGTSFGQIRALDYETPSYVEFDLSEMEVTADQDAVVLNLVRTGDFRRYSRVSFVTEADTASEGQDYRGTGGTLTFQPGEGFKQISVGLIPGASTEAEGTFRVLLSDPGPYTVLLRSELLVTIKPGGAPRLEIAPAGLGKISLQWTGLPSYTLQRSTDATRWETVACVPSVEGSRCHVLRDIAGPAYLYRLRSEE
jgi:hypothetical protein